MSEHQNTLSYSSRIMCKLKHGFLFSMEAIRFLSDVLVYVTGRLYEEIHYLEQMFINMGCFYNFICQLFFFTMCAIVMTSDLKATKKDERVITGLSTLLFYSVIGYFIARLKDIYYKNYSRPAVTSFRNYIKWICRIALEWAKAVVIVICLREQGLKYQPFLYYNLVTFLYYVSTEKTFTDLLPHVVAYFNFEILDSLEHLYVPIILHLYTLTTSITICGLVLTTPHAKYAIFSSYFVIYMRMKDLIYNYIKVLVLEKQTYASFRMATDRDLKNWDDICAVCLSNMSRARITPCNHLFHPQCLKQCLKNSYQCPLCKQDFIT